MHQLRFFALGMSWPWMSDDSLEVLFEEFQLYVPPCFASFRTGFSGPVKYFANCLITSLPGCQISKLSALRTDASSTTTLRAAASPPSTSPTPTASIWPISCECLHCIHIWKRGTAAIPMPVESLATRAKEFDHNLVTKIRSFLTGANYNNNDSLSSSFSGGIWTSNS